MLNAPDAKHVLPAFDMIILNDDRDILNDLPFLIFPIKNRFDARLLLTNLKPPANGHA